MWPFKKKIKNQIEEKKVKEEKEELKYKSHKDRFTIIVHQDENNYKIDVYDNWSTNYLPKEDREKGLVRCRTSVFNFKKELDTITINKEINQNVEEVKKVLREEFTKDRNRFIEKKSKNKKKEVKKK